MTSARNEHTQPNPNHAHSPHHNQYYSHQQQNPHPLHPSQNGYPQIREYIKTLDSRIQLSKEIISQQQEVKLVNNSGHNLNVYVTVESIPPQQLYSKWLKNTNNLDYRPLSHFYPSRQHYFQTDEQTHQNSGYFNDLSFSGVAGEGSQVIITSSNEQTRNEKAFQTVSNTQIASSNSNHVQGKKQEQKGHEQQQQAHELEHSEDSVESYEKMVEKFKSSETKIVQQLDQTSSYAYQSVPSHFYSRDLRFGVERQLSKNHSKWSPLSKKSEIQSGNVGSGVKDIRDDLETTAKKNPSKDDRPYNEELAEASDDRLSEIQDERGLFNIGQPRRSQEYPSRIASFGGRQTPKAHEKLSTNEKVKVKEHNPFLIVKQAPLKTYAEQRHLKQQQESWQSSRVGSKESVYDRLHSNSHYQKLSELAEMMADRRPRSKADDVFFLHKKKCLDQLRRNLKADHTQTMVQQSQYTSRMAKQQGRQTSSRQLELINRRPVSPQARQVTQRLYSLSKSKQKLPCKYYVRYSEQADRQRFQQFVSESSFISKHLDSVELLTIFNSLRGSQVPVDKWAAAIVTRAYEKLRVKAKQA